MKTINYRDAFIKSRAYVTRIEQSTTKLQDVDGNWYWIPNELVDSFHIDLNKTIGTDVDKKDIEHFEKIYLKYKTTDKDAVPHYYIP